VICEKCKSNKNIVYCGEHWDEEEGSGSVYLCKKCYPELVKKLKNRYNSHLNKCNNYSCERCCGEGFRRKHRNCEHNNIGVIDIKADKSHLKYFICEDCQNIIQDDSIRNFKGLSGEDYKVR
jgi:hypothetical protein